MNLLQPMFSILLISVRTLEQPNTIYNFPPCTDNGCYGQTCFNAKVIGNKGTIYFDLRPLVGLTLRGAGFMDVSFRFFYTPDNYTWVEVVTYPEKPVSTPSHSDMMTSSWKHFPRYWPFVRGIHRSPMNSPHKGQWRGALIYSLICVWINGWVDNREASDLRRYRAHYDVIVMEAASGGSQSHISGQEGGVVLLPGFAINW